MFSSLIRRWYKTQVLQVSIQAWIKTEAKDNWCSSYLEKIKISKHLIGKKMKIISIKACTEEKYCILRLKTRIHSVHYGAPMLLDVMKEVLKSEIFN